MPVCSENIALPNYPVFLLLYATAIESGHCYFSNLGGHMPTQANPWLHHYMHCSLWGELWIKLNLYRCLHVMQAHYLTILNHFLSKRSIRTVFSAVSVCAAVTDCLTDLPSCWQWLLPLGVLIHRISTSCKQLCLYWLIFHFTFLSIYHRIIIIRRAPFCNKWATTLFFVWSSF